MALPSRVLNSGVTSLTTAAICGEGASAVSAAGSTSSDATALTTMMTARMLGRGFLAGGYFNPMLAHEPRHVQAYLAALDETFAEMADAIAKNEVAARIGGPIKQSGFARLT